MTRGEWWNHSVLSRSSHHPMIRKQFPGFIIATGVRQLGVLGGVLNIFAAHPVLHELELSVRIEEVGGDGVLEAVEFPLLRRQAGLLAIAVHCAPECAPVDRIPAVRDKEIWWKVFHMCWPLSNSSSKFIPIDEQPNHQIVHPFCFGKADRAANQPLDPGP
jgi:hypothetical protein